MQKNEARCSKPGLQYPKYWPLPESNMDDRQLNTDFQSITPGSGFTDFFFRDHTLLVYWLLFVSQKLYQSISISIINCTKMSVLIIS